MRTHIVIPEEFYAPGIAWLEKELSRLTGNPVDLRDSFDQMQLLRNVPDMPSYSQALDELDLWQQVNVWSNAPVAIVTEDMTTQDVIDMIYDDDDFRWAVYAALVQPNEEESIDDAVVREFVNGPTDSFKQTMTELRNAYRLDSLG